MNTRGKMDFAIQDDESAETTVLASGFWRLKAPRWHLGAYAYPTCARERSSIFDLDAGATIAADVLSRPLGLGFLPDGNLFIPCAHTEITDKGFIQRCLHHISLG